MLRERAFADVGSDLTAGKIDLMDGDGSNARTDGTQTTQLASSTNLHDVQPSCSPAGDAIAFARGAPATGRSGIYVMHPDGRGVRMIGRGGRRAGARHP